VDLSSRMHLPWSDRRFSDFGHVPVIALPRETWQVLAGWRAAELRIVAETGGLSAAESWLRARGLRWVRAGNTEQLISEGGS
jgi:hypothetical protein